MPVKKDSAESLRLSVFAPSLFIPTARHFACSLRLHNRCHPYGGKKKLPDSGRNVFHPPNAAQNNLGCHPYGRKPPFRLPEAWLPAGQLRLLDGCSSVSIRVHLWLSIRLAPRTLDFRPKTLDAPIGFPWTLDFGLRTSDFGLRTPPPPYIGGQNLSLEPVPPCLQWVMPILKGTGNTLLCSRSGYAEQISTRAKSVNSENRHRHAKNAPESTICGVLRKRPAPQVGTLAAPDFQSQEARLAWALDQQGLPRRLISANSAHLHSRGPGTSAPAL